MSRRTDGRGTRDDSLRMPTFAELDHDDRLLTAMAESDYAALAAIPPGAGVDVLLADVMVDAVDGIHGDLPPTPLVPADYLDMPCDPAAAAVLAEYERADAEDGTAISAVPAPEPTDGGARVTRLLPSRGMSALFGAAAATVVLIAGFGAVQSAEPGSALWPLRAQIIGTRTVEVELASTLDQIEQATAAGDSERAADLLRKATNLMSQMQAPDREALEQRFQEIDDRVRSMPGVDLPPAPELITPAPQPGPPKKPAPTKDDKAEKPETTKDAEPKPPSTGDNRTTVPAPPPTVNPTTPSPTEEPTTPGTGAPDTTAPRTVDEVETSAPMTTSNQAALPEFSSEPETAGVPDPAAPEVPATDYLPDLPDPPETPAAE